MRIYCAKSGREAKPIKGPNDTKAVYKCFLPGARKNTDDKAHKFSFVSEAADFLRNHAGREFV